MVLALTVLTALIALIALTALTALTALIAAIVTGLVEPDCPRMLWGLNEKEG